MSKDKKKRELPKRSAEDKRAFKRELTEVVPHLRAFAQFSYYLLHFGN